MAKLRHRKQGNVRAKNSFESRFGMKRSAFRDLQKTDPAKAHSIRTRAYELFINRPKNYGTAN